MTSQRFSVGLREVEEEWTLDDLLDAHEVLDALEDAEAQSTQGVR